MAIKRICFFCSHSSFDTGMPISTFKLIEHFSAVPEYNVHVILPAEGELARRVRQCGIQPHLLSFNRLRSIRRMKGFLLFLISFPGSFVRICAYLRENRIDLLHFSDIIDMPFYCCGWFLKVKTVTHLRHCIESYPSRFLFRFMAFLWIDKVLCISQAVLRYSGLGDRKGEVIYNPGPDPKLFKPEKTFPPVSQLPGKAALAVAIGKLVRVKGHEHFIRMARLVESRRPGLCHFVIIGNTVPAHEKYAVWLRNRIGEYGLDKTLTILDQVPHEMVPALLSHSSVFVHLPNWQEGFGGVILEAMAMQVPVVAFDCGGINECFTSGVSGFLIEQFDVEAAAARVMELLDDESLRLRMGIEARKETLVKFSYQKHFSEIERIYRQILFSRA